MTADLIVDDFAGPGGWDVAAHALGLAPVGYEYDADACATRAAAGLRTIRADVSAVPLEPLAGRVAGVISSPPCTAFSMGGNREGQRLIGALTAAIHRQDWTWGREHDPTIWLPLEVGRWVDALRPRWIACEQVPPPHPCGEAYTPGRRSHGDAGAPRGRW